MSLQHVGGAVRIGEPEENGFASCCRNRTLRALELNPSSVRYSYFTRGIGKGRAYS